MKLLNSSLFKKPLLMAALFSLSALSVVFMILKQSNIQKTKDNIASYLQDWNYEFADDVYHKRDYRLMNKALKPLKSEAISNYAVIVGGKKVSEWSQAEELKKASSCISFQRAIRISAGPKVGYMNFCISEAKVIGKIFEGPIFWSIILMITVLIGLSAIMPLRGYKASLERTIKSLKAWKNSSDSQNIELIQDDKISNEIIKMFNQALESKIKLKDVKNELETKEAINQITIKVAHDLRSPACAINEVVSDTTEIDRNTTDFKIIEESSKSLLAICEDLLNQTKASYKYDRSSLVDIVPLVKKSVELLKRPNQNISFQFAGESTLLGKVSPVDFKRIISNLVTNSIQAIDKSENGAVLISFDNLNDFSQITITDNGCGIAETDLVKVVMPGFTKGKASGNGLGLSSSKENVETWGGRLTVVSLLGKGTSIKIQLMNELNKEEDNAFREIGA